MRQDVIALQVASEIYNAVMVASLKLSKVVVEPTVVFSFGRVTRPCPAT